MPASDPDPSPCVRLCTLDAADMCIGCGRTIDEICGWAAMAAVEKTAVRRSAAQRLERSRASSAALRSRP